MILSDNPVFPPDLYFVCVRAQVHAPLVIGGVIILVFFFFAAIIPLMWTLVIISLMWTFLKIRFANIFENYNC